MLSKNEAKYIQSLYHKKQRQQEGLFVAENPKVIEELLASNYSIKKIYATAEWIAANGNITAEIITVTDDELLRISNVQTPNKVLAIAEQKQPLLAVFNNTITLALDGIQDPGNLGTIIRIADWFGITQIICSHDTADLYNPKVIQSTMGSFTRVNIYYTDLAEALGSSNVAVYGALLDGTSIYTTGKIKEGIILIGSEGKGISDDVMKLITHPITIPRIGGAESLNAGVAAGIIVSHLV